MRRVLTAPRLAVLLAPAAGLVFALWEVHDLGGSCGYREGSHLPNFPVRVAFVLLVVLPALLTAGRAYSEGRGARGVLGLALCAAVLAGAAAGAADLWFFLSRHCYA
jgi:hypothetical protein